MLFGFLVSAILLSQPIFRRCHRNHCQNNPFRFGRICQTFFFGALLRKILILFLLCGLFFFLFSLRPRSRSSREKKMLTSLQELEAGTLQELKNECFALSKNVPNNQKSSADHIELKSTEKRFLRFSDIFLEMARSMGMFFLPFEKTRNIPFSGQ